MKCLLAPMDALSFEMPHKILHSISVPPNTLRKILEVFTAYDNVCPHALWWVRPTNRDISKM